MNDNKQGLYRLIQQWQIQCYNYIRNLKYSPQLFGWLQSGPEAVELSSPSWPCTVRLFARWPRLIARTPLIKAINNKKFISFGVNIASDLLFQTFSVSNSFIYLISLFDFDGTPGSVHCFFQSEHSFEKICI